MRIAIMGSGAVGGYFGARLAAIVASGIAILHVIGPIAARYALVASGEGQQDVD